VSLNPYRSLPDHRFWRKAIANVPSFAIDPLIDAPFRITPHYSVVCHPKVACAATLTPWGFPTAQLAQAQNAPLALSLKKDCSFPTQTL
jgi:hypothetical protein